MPIHVDLGTYKPEWDGQWLDLVDVGLRTPNEFKQMQERVGSGDEAAARAMLTEFVEGWHIANRAGPLPPPSEADFGDVPVGIIGVIREEIKKQVDSFRASE